MEQIAPRFRDPAFLDEHIRRTMAFYHPRCIDRGGVDSSTSSAMTAASTTLTRGIWSAAPGSSSITRWRSAASATPSYRDAARHGIAFLRGAHRDPPPAAMPGCSPDDVVVDGTNHCYGLAFVVLAYAKALEAGLEEAGEHPKRHGS